MAKGQLDIPGIYQAPEGEGYTAFRIEVYRSGGACVAAVKEGQKQPGWFTASYGPGDQRPGSRSLRLVLSASRLTPKAVAAGLREAAADLFARGWIAAMPDAAMIAAGVR